MSKARPPQPTDAELEILRVLWSRGDCTVRDVHELLSKSKGTRYTTILKLMQNMTAKDLVTRDESERSHVYRAKCKQDATERRLVKDLLNRGLGGAANRLVCHALNAKKITPEEIAEIRQLLDELEHRK